jgi:type II secretory pathway pseudopilin PulG
LNNLTRRRGFTLVEVLVVLGILICLMGILLPVLSHVREETRRVKCVSNLHQLTTAWLEYAADNERHFCSSEPHIGDLPPHDVRFGTPGFYWGWVMPDPPSPGNFVPTLEAGMLWQYVKNADVYRCPDEMAVANKTSYQINGLLAGTVGAPFPLHKLDELSQPSKTFVFIEGCAPQMHINTCFNTPIYPSFHLSAGGWPGENHHGSSAAAVGTGISFADGHAIFWPYSDPRSGNLLEASWGGLLGPITYDAQGHAKFPGDAAPNSPDVYQLEAWSGGPLPLSVVP